MTTTKEQLLEALAETGEKPEDIICFYQPVPPDVSYPGWHTGECGDPVRCSVHELPERKFDPGHGAPEGEPFIAFGPKYIYIKVQYDGAEWVEPIPRHPEVVRKPIPWPGQ